MSKYELKHFGIKGQKWGVRRYQNTDGSLTNAGKKRYFKPAHEDYQKAHSRKSVRQMSNQELRDRNNRLNMEAQYYDLKKRTDTGKRAVQGYIKTAGTIAAVAGATITYKNYGKQILDKIGPLVIGK